MSMHPPDVHALERRLARLEREHRQWRRLALAGLAIVAALVAMGQAPVANHAKTVEAERFVVRDAGGRPRAMLHTDAAGSPILEMRDAAGQPRLSVGIRDEVAYVSLGDTTGKAGVIMHALPNGRPSLTFNGPNGARRMVLFLSVNGSPTLAFSDDQRQSRLVINDLGNGPIGLSLYDKAGRPRAVFDLAPDGSPTIAFFDENRHSRAILGHAELVGGTGGAGNRREASSLLLFDRTGNVMWQAP